MKFRVDRLLGAAVLVALCGCVAIPYGSSESVPDLTSRLPPDLLERSDEVLVLTQTDSIAEIRETSETKSVIDAYFLKAYQLKSLNQRLTLTSNQMLGVAPLGFGIDIPLSNTSMDRICVLARDGREITLTFRSWEDEIRPLDLNRRDAIVAELRSADASPFKKVDGPCGVAGEFWWDKDERARVTAYIAGLPAIESRVNESALGRVLGAGWQQAAARAPEPESLLLLAGTSWRGAKSAEPPVFLSGIGFDELSAAAQGTRESDLVKLLPSYASGERALENTLLERFCVASRDGRILRWEKASSNRETFDAAAGWAPQELAMMHEDGPGPACLPRGSHAWPAADRERVVAFLRTMHAVDWPPAIAEAKLKSLIVGPERARRANYLLIAMDMPGSAPPRAYPFFLEGGDDDGLVTALQRVPRLEFSGLVASLPVSAPTVAKDFQPNELCLISAAGTFFEFVSLDVPGWQLTERQWDASESKDRERALGAWRDDAIIAVKSDDAYYPASELCRLGAHRDWPQDLRDKVTAFLDRLPDRASASLRK